MQPESPYDTEQVRKEVNEFRTKRALNEGLYSIRSTVHKKKRERDS